MFIDNPGFTREELYDIAYRKGFDEGISRRKNKFIITTNGVLVDIEKAISIRMSYEQNKFKIHYEFEAGFIHETFNNEQERNDQFEQIKYLLGMITPYKFKDAE